MQTVDLNWCTTGVLAREIMSCILLTGHEPGAIVKLKSSAKQFPIACFHQLLQLSGSVRCMLIELRQKVSNMCLL